MIHTFTFRGPEVNLGVWGVVKKGDILAMTDKEAEGLQGDERFKLANPKEFEAFKVHCSNKTLNPTEQARVEGILDKSKQVSVIRRQVDQMPKLEIIQELRAKQIPFGAGSAMSDLKQKVVALLTKELKLA